MGLKSKRGIVDGDFREREKPFSACKIRATIDRRRFRVAKIMKTIWRAKHGIERERDESETSVCVPPF